MKVTELHFIRIFSAITVSVPVRQTPSEAEVQGRIRVYYYVDSYELK